MRTTVDLDEDVLAAAKELARRERRTAGQVISDLVRQALTQTSSDSGAQEPKAFYGFKPFAARGAVVTNEIIDRLRDEEGV